MFLERVYHIWQSCFTAWLRESLSDDSRSCISCGGTRTCGTQTGGIRYRRGSDMLPLAPKQISKSLWENPPLVLVVA